MDLRPPRIFFIGLCAWAAYIAARSVVLGLLPSGDWASYVEQDLIVSLFRLGTLLFSLWLGRLAYDREQWWGGKGRPGVAWGLGTALVLAGVVGMLGRQSAPLEGLWGVRAVEVALNILVAFNEEFGWRGVLLLSLRDWLGEKAALWGTAGLFTLMHLGYQPLQALPHVFVVGLALSAARLRGLNLMQLVAIHAGIDIVLALYLPSGAESHWGYSTFSSSVALVAAGLLWFKPPPQAEAKPLPA